MTLFKDIWRRSDYYFQDSSLYPILFSWKYLDKPVIPIPYRYNLSYLLPKPLIFSTAYIISNKNEVNILKVEAGKKGIKNYVDYKICFLCVYLELINLRQGSSIMPLTSSMTLLASFLIFLYLNFLTYKIRILMVPTS